MHQLKISASRYPLSPGRAYNHTGEPSWQTSFWFETELAQLRLLWQLRSCGAAGSRLCGLGQRRRAAQDVKLFRSNGSARMTYATVQNAVALMLILTELTDNVTSAASIFVECILAEYLFLFSVQIYISVPFFILMYTHTLWALSSGPERS